MRNPRRWRAVAIVACVLGAGLVLAAARLPPAWAGDVLRAVLFGVGSGGVMFGVVGGWMAHRAARAQAALERGDAVLSRWRVEAADWQAFLAADAAMGPVNELSVPDEIPADGIEVVIGEDAIDIGGSVHVLPRHGAPE